MSAAQSDGVVDALQHPQLTQVYLRGLRLGGRGRDGGGKKGKREGGRGRDGGRGRERARKERGRVGEGKQNKVEKMNEKHKK